MTGETKAIDWVERARQDARSARRLLLDPSELEDAAYHVQQAVEKAAKAILIQEGTRFPRGSAGHDLDKLAKLIRAGSELHARAQALSDLTPWATAFRYPADDPLTAQPIPTKQDIQRRLDEAEAFVELSALLVGTSGLNPS